MISALLLVHEVPLLPIYPGQLMPHDLSITLAGLLYHCPVSLSTGSQDVSHQKDFCSPRPCDMLAQVYVPKLQVPVSKPQH